MEQNANINLKEKSYSFPVITGTEGEQAIDITQLRQETGFITLDTGFKNTGATTSSITFVDGEKGILRYRGYSIEQLAEQSTFLDIAYLLICGQLPNPSEYEHFTERIKNVTLIHEEMKKFYDAFPLNTHPMAIMTSLTSALPAFYMDSNGVKPQKELIDIMVHRLLAKLPTIASWAYKHNTGDPVMYPQSELEYCDNLQYMLFASPKKEFEINPLISNTLDKLLILHADHEQNCSTSTVRLAGSSRTNLYTAVSAGLGALWGPLHGGANQAVMEMLENIKKDGGDVQKWIDKAKDKDDPFRLMGFGHRVYKNFDPRAKIIKKSCDEVLDQLNKVDPILDIARKLEEAALNDGYFIEKKLFPNVDFYSGIIYKALGIPKNMYTVMFALGRLPGWIAQWKEMIDNDEPIGRPRQIYVGEKQREFVPAGKRKSLSQ